MTAVRVVCFRGERHIPGPKKITCVHSEVPLPTRPVVGNMPQLVGTRFGRFTVVGLGLRKRERKGEANKPAAWVVRCDCGNYEHRTAKAIRNPANHIDRCQDCHQVRFEKHAFETGVAVR